MQTTKPGALARSRDRRGSGYRVNYPRSCDSRVAFLEATVRRIFRQVSLPIPTPTSSTIEPCHPITVRSGRSHENHSRLRDVLASKSTFLTQLRSIDTRSREFPSALTKMLASPEGENTAISLQGDDALTLVDILDQVSKPMITGTPSLILLHRCSRLRTWRLTYGRRVFACSGESVAQIPFCHVLVSSRRSQRRATSQSLPEDWQMCGVVAIMGIGCA